MNTQELNHFDSLPDDVQMQLLPAFVDRLTGQIYLSRYANGELAPVHVFDGLPDEILNREQLNLISGFVLNGEFLTHDQAARRLSV